MRIAIAGAGIGGLAMGALLLRDGHDVHIYEQARAFAPVGAGIQLTPNAIKALRPFGLEAPLRAVSFVADEALNREWDSGDLTNVLPMGAALEARYGAPDLMMHRRTLHGALSGLVPADRISLGKRLATFEDDGNAVCLGFSDGSQFVADMMVAADGIHSVVREILFGAERPTYTGRAGYRTTFPTALLRGLDIDPRAKWWGKDRHVVHYYTNAARDEVYFIAVTPEPDFSGESWSKAGDKSMLLEAFKGFHPRVLGILEAAPDVRKWALMVRDPMPMWHLGRVVLLGDACHPMLPSMAQGAAAAIEDAVVLSRCMKEFAADGLPAVFTRYQRLREHRTARMQQTNRDNNWLRVKTDTDWVYDYDPWSAPL